MSGPQRNLSAMIGNLHSRNAELHIFLDRLRAANRRLTGSDGRPPTPLAPPTGMAANPNTLKQEEPPLMVQLTIALDALEGSSIEIEAELSYLERHSETGAPPAEAAYTAKDADAGHKTGGGRY